MKERFLMPVSVCTLNKWVLRRIFLSWNAPKQSIHWEKREITKNKIKLPKLEPTQGKENTLPYFLLTSAIIVPKNPAQFMPVIYKVALSSAPSASWQKFWFNVL